MESCCFYVTCLFGRIRGLPPKPLGVTGSRIRSRDSPEFVNLTLILQKNLSVMNPVINIILILTYGTSGRAGHGAMWIWTRHHNNSKDLQFTFAKRTNMVTSKNCWLFSLYSLIFFILRHQGMSIFQIHIHFHFFFSSQFSHLCHKTQRELGHSLFSKAIFSRLICISWLEEKLLFLSCLSLFLQWMKSEIHF